MSITAITGSYAIGNEQYGSGILLLGVAFIGVKGKIGFNKSKIKVDSRTRIINDFRAGKITLESNKHKGNLGELIMDDHYLKLGYERISLEKVISLDDKIKKGIDGIYYLSDGHPPFIIAEAKYGSSRQIMTRHGLQMSYDWIFPRLEKAVGRDMANKILDEIALNPKNVGSNLIRVDSLGDITKVSLDRLGRIIK